jgi:glycerophosphoryl diester phosphodiesterase
MIIRPRPGHPYLAGAPLFFAHRGGARLAPENTMAAFRSAVEEWEADVLELDVHRTLDGKLVVIHDATVDRTTEGQGAVASLPWSELRTLDAGYHFTDPGGNRSFRGRGVTIPLFEEVLETFPGTRLNVDSKEPLVALELMRMVLAHGAQHRVLLASEFEEGRADRLGYPGPTSATRRQIRTFYLSHRLPGGGPYTPRVDALQVPYVWEGRQVTTLRFVREAHRRNIPVHVWTVDDPELMRLLLSWEVDGLQTDRPDLLVRVLHEEVGRPLPPGAK